MIIGHYQKNMRYQRITIDLKDVDTEEKLFKAFYLQLKFPEWFGFNWDALYECLTCPFFQVQQDIMYEIINAKCFMSKFGNKFVEFCKIIVDNGIEDLDLDIDYKCIICIQD